MKREEQNKRWAEHSNEVQEDIIERYMSYDTSVPVLKALKESLEYTYGKHNLQPSLTYEEVASELFESGYYYYDYVYDDIIAISGECEMPLACTSSKQVKKICAINKLLNVAKYLNKNEDGSEWVPDWENDNELKWHFCITYNDILKHCHKTNINSSFVYFKAEELLDQALQILGEDIIRTALTTIY